MEKTDEKNNANNIVKSMKNQVLIKNTFNKC